MIEMTPEELAEAYYATPTPPTRELDRVSSVQDALSGSVNTHPSEPAVSAASAGSISLTQRTRRQDQAVRDVTVNLSALQVLELVHNLLAPDEHVRLERCNWPVDPGDPDAGTLNWYATVGDCHGYGTTILAAWTHLLRSLIRRKFPHTR